MPAVRLRGPAHPRGLWSKFLANKKVKTPPVCIFASEAEVAKSRKKQNYVTETIAAGRGAAARSNEGANESSRRSPEEASISRRAMEPKPLAEL